MNLFSHTTNNVVAFTKIEMYKTHQHPINGNNF